MMVASEREGGAALGWAGRRFGGGAAGRRAGAGARPAAAARRLGM